MCIMCICTVHRVCVYVCVLYARTGGCRELLNKRASAAVDMCAAHGAGTPTNHHCVCPSLCL